MNKIELAACYVAIYVIGVLFLLLCIARARPLRTDDGRTEAVTPGTAPATERPPAGECPPTDPDGPPVTLKLPPAYSDGDLLVTCKRFLLITGCTDPLMWYAKMIGKEVPYLGTWAADKAYKSREPAGYVNIVHFKDARIVIREPK